LYDQHKKLKTTRGTFDVGFTCKHTGTRFSDDKTFNIVGFTVSAIPIISDDANGNDPRDDSQMTMISYPSTKQNNTTLKYENLKI
jgi:hypothetical protein